MMMTRMTGFRKVVVPQLTAIGETDPTSGLRLVDLLSPAGAVVEIRDESYLTANAMLLAFAVPGEE